MARRILELHASAIVDLYELKNGEPVRFARLFLKALMDDPKSLWHPCMVVIDLCTRGRKRGFSAVLATQRLSKLHKDAAAETLNKRGWI